MKNPFFNKLLILSGCMLVVLAGFWMLPGTDDFRTQAAKAAKADFLREFHDAETVKKPWPFPGATVLTDKGERVDLGGVLGRKLTIVNFWASWCAPCLKELPSLATLRKAIPDAKVLAVSLDMQKTLPELARIFENDALKDMPWYYDDTGVLRKTLSLPIYPATYILDDRGNVLYILQGPADWASPRALSFVEYLLNGY